MIRKFLILTLCAATLGCSVSSQSFNKAKTDSLLNAISINNKAMFSVSISQKGVPIYTNAIGSSFIAADKKTPATTATRYRIGSITKMFTGVMIFQMIEEGKLKLSNSLGDFFPDLPNASKITVNNLLSHTSGLHNFTNDSSYLTILSKKVTQAEMLAKFKVLPVDFEPGTKTAYSNTNFILLGYLIEKLDRKPYAAAVKSRVSGKLSLKDTYYGSKISIAQKEADSYVWKDGWKKETETDMSIPAGAGAMVSTPSDLTKFIEGLFAGKLISDSSLTEMKTIKDGFGKALFAVPFAEKKGFGHNGGIDGFQSQVLYFPEDQLAIAYTANGVNTSMNSVVIGLLSIYYNRPYVIPAFEEIKFTVADLDKFTGTYSTEQIPLKIVVTRKDAVLYAQATGQPAFPLEAMSTTSFKFEPAGLVLSFDQLKNQLTLKQGGGSYLFTKEK